MIGLDVEGIETVDYRVSPARRVHFKAEVRRYWPGLPPRVLKPAYCGIRPKLTASLAIAVRVEALLD